VSGNLSTAAAIPPRHIRAERGRLLAELAAGGVGSWDWSPPSGGVEPSEGVLVNIKNDGAAAIKKFEAVSLSGTTFSDQLAACEDALIAADCGHGNYCNLGLCQNWPQTYEQIYLAAAAYGVTFKASNTNAIPTPGNLGDWAVSTSDLAVGATGTAYAGGTFYAMIWDPDELLAAAGELRYVDLPQSLSGYTSATDSSPEILLPLRVRGNGRGRILWYDDTTILNNASGGSGATYTWAMTKARLAIIERTRHFTYPTIPVDITTEATEGTNQWTYHWHALHNASCTSVQIGTAVNLAEVNNTADKVNGVDTDDLDDCFGEGGWELQSTADSDQDVLLTIAMDAAGGIQPYFCLQNQIVPT